MGTTLPHGDIRATVQGRNYGQIVVGNGNQVLSILVGHGGVLSLQQQPAPPVSEPRPQPVDMRPRRIHSLPGWEPEARQAVTALERGLLVELWGADEPARTAILRFLAYQPVAERFAAGVAYLDGAAHTDDDLLQALHQVFYRTQPPTRLDEIEIRHLLRRQQALLLLDRAELEDRALDRVLNAAPEATFVLASARSHGRAELCSVALRDEQAPLPGLPARLAQASQGARSILSAMSILGGIAVSARHLAAIVSLPDFITALEEVLQAGLVFQNDLYSLAPGVAEAAAETWDLSPWRAAAAAHFTAWIEENRDAPDVLLSQLSLLLHLMRTLGESGQWVHALHLGKALEPVVALSGRWGVWQHLLERLQPAAEAAGDRQMTAYVLHQLGTRLLCLGKDGARTLLEQALAIWQVLGDEAGAAVTSANLAQLAPSHAAAQDTQPPELTPPGRGLWRGIIGGIAALAMVGAAAWVVLNWPLWPPPPPSAQVEPARLDFDPVQAGGSPVQAKLLLHNTGDAPFPVKGVRLTGNEAAQFHIEDDGCTNTKVDPASACAVVVSFSPAVPGGATAQVEFAVAGIAPVRADLAGTAAGQPFVEPATVDFGRWQIKTTAEPARAVTLTNPGPTRLEVTDALITGPAAREFKVTETTCRNRSLSAGESCTVTLAFLPAFQSDKAATLTFSGSQPLPHVTLAGTGILTGFRVLPAEAVFGESDVVELAITSLGPDAMMLRDVRIEGSDSFTVAAGQCIAVPLDPDQSCYITVKWDRKPRQRGTLILKGEGTERTVNLVAAGI